MTFLHQFSLLWLVAWGALAFFILSVGWLVISAVWRLSRKELQNMDEGLIPSNHGEPEALLTPPKKLTAAQAAKMLIVLGAVLLAYDAGTKIEKRRVLESYFKDYEAWKAVNANAEKEHAAWAERKAAREAKENRQ